MTEPDTNPDPSPGAIDVSLVLPVFNERENLDELHSRLREVMDGTGRSYEILYIDDGSTDGSTAWLAAKAAEDERTALIQFRRNFGQTAALAAGFDHARGAIIVTLDADLQNDPADIPRLLDAMTDDVDVVSGWRKDRQDAYWSRIVPSRMANRLISRITRVELHDYGCTLKAYRREVIKNVSLYGEMHRFIPAISNWMGVTVREIDVRHHPRKAGKSKYGLSRTLTVLLDLINIKFLLSYSTRPIQIFGSIGLLSLLAALIVGLVVIGLKIGTGFDITGNPLFLGAILFFLVGIQFIVLGLMAEIVIRVYHESQGKTTYAIKRTVGDVGESVRS